MNCGEENWINTEQLIMHTCYVRLPKNACLLLHVELLTKLQTHPMPNEGHMINVGTRVALCNYFLPVPNPCNLHRLILRPLTCDNYL
jgi:hypothetical protein